MHLVHSLFTGSSSTIHLDEATTTANQIAAEGARLASKLRDQGLVPGSRLAVWAANGLGYLRLLAAAAAGRFIVVSVNTRFSAAEAGSIVSRSGATLLVTDRAESDLSGLPAIPLERIGEELDSSAAVDPKPLDAAEASDPYIVFTTSGTTSAPKMVLHDQRSITVHAHDVARAFGYDRPESRVLVDLPLCGVFGLCSLTGALAGGSEIWLPSSFDPPADAALVEGASVTAANGSDDMFHRLLLTGADLSTLHTCGYARFNSALDGIVARAEAAGVWLTGLYGMSEVQALFALRDPTETAAGRERPGGRTVSPDAAVKVIDPDTGADMAPGGDGELLVRGPSLFSGYLAEGGESVDEALSNSAHLVDADGRWFRTGDLGRIEEDGSFTYVTRIGDVLRLGGFLVSPAEIEAVLLEIDGVVEAQVVAVARSEGARPVAFVVAEGPVDEEKAISHCRSRLARFKCPIAVLEIEELPVTAGANGTKIQRNRLRDMAVELLGSRP